MKKSKKTLAMLAPTLALGAGMVAMAAGSASAAGSSTFEAQLNPINHSAASGTVMISLNGSQATITEHVTGLAATFGGKPYPHVQHIHIGAQGTCPGTSADKNGDGVISTTEGAPFYGGIGATLSTSGDTSPAAGTTLTVAPAGSTINYNRTITLDAKTISRRCSPAPRSSSSTATTRPRCPSRLRARRATWCPRCRWPPPRRPRAAR